MINQSLREYIEGQILPMYDGFDAAHRRNHAAMVIEQSLAIAAGLDVDEDMVYAIAAYHDTGLGEGRAVHHLASGRIVRGDGRLGEWFADEQIETMAQAVEDHRASAAHEPRSIYGMIVAEADRFIDTDVIIERTVQYGLDHYRGFARGEAGREQHFERTLAHMRDKYGDGGYLKLWFADSPNAARLEALRAVIRDPAALRSRFDAIYDKLVSDR